MFSLSRWNSFDDIFNFHRDTDRLLNQFWNDLSARPTRQQAVPFQVHNTEDGWRVDVPLPGIDPKDVTIEAAGSTLNIRAEQHGGERDGELRYEQTLAVPQFLDLEKVTATHRHGMLELALPLKDSVKPRRIQITGVTEDQNQKQLTNA